MRVIPAGSGFSSRKRWWLWVGLLTVVVISSGALVLDQWRREGPLWAVIMTGKVPYQGVSFEGEVKWINGTFVGEIEHPTTGFQRVMSRGPDDGLKHGWSQMRLDETGLLVSETLFRHGEQIRMTVWNFDGTIQMQRDEDPESCSAIGRRIEEVTLGDLRRGYLTRVADGIIAGEDIYLPPWKWGATDQGEPKHGWDVELTEGRKSQETQWHDGKALSKTVWNRDGSVRKQIRILYDGEQLTGIESRNEAPWWPVSDEQ